MLNRLFNLVFIMLCFGMVSAQIPNNSFENWTKIFNYDNPDDWKTGNAVLALIPGNTRFTVLKTNNASDLQTAALLKTTYIPTTGEEIPGVLSTADIGVDFNTLEPIFTGGLPFTGRPEFLSFDYMYFPALNDSTNAPDTGGVFLYLTKYDTVQKVRDTIGFASFSGSDSVSSYTTHNLQITYFTNDDPDTLMIVFTSSVSLESSNDETELYIDNINVSWFTGIQTGFLDKDKATIYPNPAQDELHVMQTGFGGELKFVVYDLLGNRVKYLPLINGDNVVDISLLPIGLYVYQILDNNNRLMQSGKFTRVLQP
jgi:Secretion system C-terminal sorting domain/Putative carbohydrate metabolism domain